MRLGSPPDGCDLVLGEIVLVHMKEGLHVGGELQLSQLQVVGRLAGDLYCRTTDVFAMKRPPTSYD